MEVFCHVNELGVDGYANLRTLVLMSPRVVMWAPSATYMQELREKQHPLLPTPDELYWYIQNGHIQIMCRETWISGPESRIKHHGGQNRWPHGGTWTEFDDKLRELYVRDLAKGPTTARVRKFDDEASLWAEVQVKEKKVSSRNVLKSAGENLPPAYLQKMARYTSPHDKAVSLLRDARNHGLAFVASNTDRNVGAPGDIALLKVFMEARPFTEPKLRDSEREHNVVPLLSALDSVFDSLVNALKPVNHSTEAFERVQKVLNDRNERDKLLEWIHVADQSATNLPDSLVETALRTALSQRIRSGATHDTLWEYVRPRSVHDLLCDLLEVVVLGVHTLHGLPYPLLALGAAPAALRQGGGVLQWLGWMKDDVAFERWIMYLAGLKGNPRRQEVLKILSAASAR